MGGNWPLEANYLFLEIVKQRLYIKEGIPYYKGIGTD
jgi:hypothetical protein